MCGLLVFLLRLPPPTTETPHTRLLQWSSLYSILVLWFSECAAGAVVSVSVLLRLCECGMLNTKVMCHTHSCARRQSSSFYLCIVRRICTRLFLCSPSFLRGFLSFTYGSLFCLFFVRFFFVFTVGLVFSLFPHCWKSVAAAADGPLSPLSQLLDLC